MYLLSVILKIRYARRGKGCSFSFIDRIGLFIARIHYKFITIETLYIISHFINRAQRFSSFLIRFKHVTDVKKALDRLAFFGNRLYF
jgi:hypothetical protein